jgi:hypothetical protein
VKNVIDTSQDLQDDKLKCRQQKYHQIPTRLPLVNLSARTRIVSHAMDCQTPEQDADVGDNDGHQYYYFYFSKLICEPKIGYQRKIYTENRTPSHFVISPLLSSLGVVVWRCAKHKVNMVRLFNTQF